MSLVQLEQTKLTAIDLNGLAIALFAVGGPSPFVSSLYSGTGPTPSLLAGSAICIIGSLVLHVLARLFLMRNER